MSIPFTDKDIEVCFLSEVIQLDSIQDLKLGLVAPGPVLLIATKIFTIKFSVVCSLLDFPALMLLKRSPGI